MDYFKRQSIHERLVGDTGIVLTADGDVIIQPKGGDTNITGNLIVSGDAAGPKTSNILYVTKDGKDTNDGKSADAGGAKATIKSAVAAATSGTTIIVAPGEYQEDNPITLPDFVTVVGSGELRNVKIFPKNNTQTIFYMGNGCYLYQLTFRALRAPAWCVEIRPGTLCTTSPYVQNCTNMNGPWLNDGTEFVPFVTEQLEGVTPGARPLLTSQYASIPYAKQINETGGGGGMFVDGDQYNPASLVKSMVADAYTQVAQGGPGFEITNFGYTQIVSCFTVFCTIGFKTTKGGYLSISNSVSDFGTQGVVADGFYPTSYTDAKPTQNYSSSVASVTIDSGGIGYTSAPTVTFSLPEKAGGVQAQGTASIDITTGKLNAISVGTAGSGYASVPSVTITGGGASLQATATANLATNLNVRLGSLRDIPQVGSIVQFTGDGTYYYITAATQDTAPFMYNEVTCRRDLTRIIDAVTSDIVFDTNYQSLAAGRSYLRKDSKTVILDQLAPTIYGIEAARDQMKLNATSDTVKNLIDEKIGLITSILNAGDSAGVPDLVYNDLSTIDIGNRRAKDNVVENRQFILEEMNAYIRKQFRDLSYNKETFDITLAQVIKGLTFYVVFGSSWHIVRAAEQFTYRDTFKQLYQNVFRYIKTPLLALTEVDASNLAKERVTQGLDILNNIIFDGDSTSLDPEFPYHTGALENNKDARDHLLNNKPFLGAEYVAYLKTNETTLTSAWDSTTEQLYVDDFEKIVDALAFDILYGGNSAIVWETKYLFDTRKISTFNQADATALGRGIAHMRGVIQKVVRGLTHTPTSGNSETQNFSANDATLTEAQALDVLLQNTQNVIEERDKTQLPTTETYPTYSQETAALVSAAGAIFQSESTQISNAYNWIRANYPDLSYDVEKCRRDVGFIIDATYRDAQLGGNHNSITAGLAYQRANSAYLNDEQKPATLLALKEAKRLSVLQCAADTNLATNVGNLWDDVITIAEFNQLPSEGTTYPDPGPASQVLINAKNQLINNRAFLIADVNAFVSSNYHLYHEDKCRRDTGYIIDAGYYDAVLNTNYNAVTAGLSYQRYNATYLQNNQKTQTVGAITYTKGQMANALSANVTAQTRSNLCVDEILDIINNGVVSTDTAADPLVFNAPATAGVNITNARDRLQANRTFLAKDVVNYISNNFPSHTFNPTKCERDVKYIIDALTYDVTYGGNSATWDAANSYWVDGVTTQVPGQQAETASGFNHLQLIVDEVLLGIAVSPQSGNSESQVTSGGNASSVEVDSIAGNIQIVENVIEFGVDNLPTKVYPDVNNLGIDAGILSAANNLASEKENIKDSTITYVNTTYNGFSHDIEKCTRDTGYLIDAIVHDLLYVSNVATLIATRSYFLGSTNYIPTYQKAVTVSAYQHLKSIIDDIIIGNAITKQTGNAETQSVSGGFGTATEATTAQGLTDIFINAINNATLVGTPGEIQPDFSWLPSTTRSAALTYFNASETIKDGVITFIFNNIVDHTHNEIECERDIGYIVDAVMYDIMYGGNKQHRRAGESYKATGTGIEEYSVKYLASLTKDVSLNNVVTRSDGLSNSQALGQGKAVQTTTIPDGSTTAGSNIQLFINRIAQAIAEKQITNWTEINHNHALGDASRLSERNQILAVESNIIDTAIADLNEQYGGIYDVNLFPGIIAVDQGTQGLLYNVSTVSTSGHAFEYVGAGVTYNALPFFGGSPIQANEIVETNQGKVFAGGTVDQIGNFRVGNFFSVNALTGAITLNANEIDLSGLSAVGPFIRNSVPVGVELQEVSDNVGLISSLGTQDINTVPTQNAVAQYVGNRFLNKLSGGTVTGNIQLDADLTTTNTTFNLVNTNATDINFGGAASQTITIGNSQGLVKMLGALTVVGIVEAAGFKASVFADDSSQMIDAVNNKLTANTGEIGSLVLTTDLSVQHGGTGISVITQHGVVYGNTADAVAVTDAAGTSDATTSFQVLTVTGSSDATPKWTDTIDGGSF